MKSLHHSFDIDLATVYGVDEAILIHHFQHWIRINQRRKGNFHEGRTWTYQTLDEIAAVFPYWTVEEVRAIVERLCTGKGRKSKKALPDFEPVLIKGNFNRARFDQTTWYAFVDEAKFVNSNSSYEREISQIDSVDLPNALGDVPNGNGGSPRPIPDTIPDTKTKIVCYPSPVAPDSIPSKVVKSGMDGSAIEATVEGVFSAAVTQNKNWTAQEIRESWKILAEYKGPIRDVFRFIEGTIEKLRNKKKSDYLSKNIKGNACQPTQEKLETSKVELWADDSKGRPSLGLLEAETKKP